jgi:TatD DNase family protein
MVLLDSHSHHSSSVDVISIENIIIDIDDISYLSNAQYYSAGIHPWYTSVLTWQLQFEILQEIAKHQSLIAIGECGFDKAIDLDMATQENVFKAQILLSEEIEKPLFVHAVRSYNEILNIRNSTGAKQTWMIHGFNSSLQMAQQLMDSGCLLSFGKSVLKASMNLNILIEQIPLDKLLIESDEERHLLPKIYNIIAKIKQLSLEQLIESQRDNWRRVFNINSFNLKEKS